MDELLLWLGKYKPLLELGCTLALILLTAASVSVAFLALAKQRLGLVFYEWAVLQSAVSSLANVEYTVDLAIASESDEEVVQRLATERDRIVTSRREMEQRVARLRSCLGAVKSGNQL